MRRFRDLLKFKNMASDREILKCVLDGLYLDLSNILVLACAIIVASIGLNMDSIAAVIGAMLISPIMATVVGTGYGIGIHNKKLIKRALKVFFIEILTSIVVATIYFKLSPVKEITEQIVGRTNPMFGDILIAFVSGIAGMVGFASKSLSNVIPGVAIATALMPPLCVIGYGIANWQLEVVLGSTMLFIINIICVCVATVIVVKLLNLTRHKRIKRKKI